MDVFQILQLRIRVQSKEPLISGGNGVAQVDPQEDIPMYVKNEF